MIPPGLSTSNTLFIPSVGRFRCLCFRIGNWFQGQLASCHGGNFGRSELRHVNGRAESIASHSIRSGLRDGTSGRRAWAGFCSFAMPWRRGCTQLAIKARYVDPNRLSRDRNGTQCVGNWALAQKLTGRPKIRGDSLPVNLRQTRSSVLLQHLNYHPSY